MSKLSAAFFVPGDPKPKGSLRIFGPGKFIPDSTGMLEWCHRITEAAKATITRRGVEGPLSVSLRFSLRRPKGHFGKGGAVRPSAPARPAKKPDIDKLARAVLDAITVSGVWIDDAQVVRLNAEKNYSGEPGVLVCLEDA
jgi:crossover junction endodeoxyribonuclease RusA